MGGSEGSGTVMMGVQGTWVLGGWGPEVYQICRPRGPLRAGIASNSPSTYRIIFLFSLLFFLCTGVCKNIFLHIDAFSLTGNISLSKQAA